MKKGHRPQKGEDGSRGSYDEKPRKGQHASLKTKQKEAMKRETRKPSAMAKVDYLWRNKQKGKEKEGKKLAGTVGKNKDL